MHTRRLRAPVVLAIAGVLLIASVGAAQFRRGGRFGYGQMRENPPYDGSFQFCRIMFRNAMDGDGGGWNVDWPRADQNLSFRFSELTTTSVIITNGHWKSASSVRRTTACRGSCGPSNVTVVLVSSDRRIDMLMSARG